MSLFFAYVLRDLPIPFILASLAKTPIWNMLVEDYMVSIFDFANKFLLNDGAILFFHPNDLHVLKEIKSYLESYNFHIRMHGQLLTFYNLPT
jgi:hypothetical protein